MGLDFSGKDASTEFEGMVAVVPVPMSAAKESSFIDRETAYSRLLNGCQM